MRGVTRKNDMRANGRDKAALEDALVAMSSSRSHVLSSRRDRLAGDPPLLDGGSRGSREAVQRRDEQRPSSAERSRRIGRPRANSLGMCLRSMAQASSSPMRRRPP